MWMVIGLAVIGGGGAPATAQNPSRKLDINVSETTWGFDGKAVREAFVPLSLLVQNTGPTTASGTFRLTRNLPLEIAREPPIEMPFDIPPFEERWVQIVPFVHDDSIPHSLNWGPAPGQTVEIPQPRLGAPATVLLANPGERGRPTGILRRFRTNLFPVSVTATDALGTVFLDTVPDFQGARLQSFLEWLKRGGAVVVLHGENHEFPRFPSTLAVLNDPAPRFLVGAGEVRRVALQARDIDSAQLRLATATGRSPRPSRETITAFNDPYRAYNGRIPWGRDRKVLDKLESVSRFERRWWLIYPLAILYLLMLFPGAFAMSRTTGGVRRFYIAYFVSAAVFSWAFKSLGGVGGGAKNRLRSATIARQLTPGIFDCTQWTSIAAVDGGWFALRHKGSGRLYAPCEDFETPRGLVTGGGDAQYEVDVPVASTRSAICRFRADSPPVAARLQSTEFIDGRLAACSVVFDGLPAAPLEAFVCHRESIFRLRQDPDQSQWANDRRRPMATSIFISNLERLPDYRFAQPQTAAQVPQLSPEFYRSLEQALIGNTFDVRSGVEPGSCQVPDGLVRIMALVEADDAFAGQIDGFDDVQGCVLYVIDLPMSAN